MRHTIVALLASLALGAGLSAQDRKADSAGTVSGTWNMGLQGEHAIQTTLVLEQNGNKVKGTVGAPTEHGGHHPDVSLSGEFNGRALKLSGTVGHGGHEVDLEITGTLTDKGTLEGHVELPHHGRVPFTAERVGQGL